MTKHISYRGVPIDMDGVRRENEHTVALGNARANARGDRLDDMGRVAKTAEQLAREHHRGKTAVINTGLKGPLPEDPSIQPTGHTRQTVKDRTAAQRKETELASGDIIVDDNAS